MLRTRFCERFGIEAPIVVAPMGPDLTGPELVAAACNAGGFGILQAQLCPPPMLRQQIRHLRTLTSRPFGVNFVLHFPHRAGVGVCIEERVAALSFFWGDPAEFGPPPMPPVSQYCTRLARWMPRCAHSRRASTSSSCKGLKLAGTLPVTSPPWCCCLASWTRSRPPLSSLPEASPMQEASRPRSALVPTAS